MLSGQDANGPGDRAKRVHFPVWLAIVCAVVAGAFVAIQSRINGELARRLDDGFSAATISFGSGLLILLIALAFWKPGRAGIARVRHDLRDGTLRWWMLAGGTAGAFLVLTQGLTVAVLGVALFSVATVAGQSIGGLLIDTTRVVPGGPRPITLARGGGAVLAIVAVLCAASTHLGGDVPVWMLVLPFIAGLGLGWQQAVNGRVRASAGSALTATVGNFVVGTAVLLVALAVHLVISGPPEALPAEPWLYLGGLIGCLFIAASALLVHITGALLLSLAMIAGQMSAAVALDAFFPAPGTSLAPATLIGAALALAAVAVASIRRRRGNRAVSPTS